MIAFPRAMQSFKEVIFLVNGIDIYSCLKYESGVLRFKEYQGLKLKEEMYMAATVAVLPEAEEVDIQIKETDL